MDIVIYSRAWCPYCVKAKTLLRAKGLEWREFDVTLDKGRQREMIERSGQHTVPQVLLDGEPSAATTTSLASMPPASSTAGSAGNRPTWRQSTTWPS